MNHRLRRISPASLAALFATFGFVVSIGTVIFTVVVMRPGVTANLNGFFSMQFTNELNPAMLVIYPIANAIAGMVAGFLTGWFYNLWAHFTGGVNVEISDGSSR
jgi:uncharacterized membrane protein